MPAILPKQPFLPSGDPLRKSIGLLLAVMLIIGTCTGLLWTLPRRHSRQAVLANAALTRLLNIPAPALVPSGHPLRYPILQTAALRTRFSPRIRFDPPAAAELLLRRPGLAPAKGVVP